VGDQTLYSITVLAWNVLSWIQKFTAMPHEGNHIVLEHNSFFDTYNKAQVGHNMFAISTQVFKSNQW
jgi:hypothetical protein